jgi:hypothetical protein
MGNWRSGRRAEDYAALGARVLVELQSESLAVWGSPLHVGAAEVQLLQVDPAKVPPLQSGADKE